MKRFVEGLDRHQVTLFPECLEDWIAEDNPVRVIDAFVDALELGKLGFVASIPKQQAVPLLCSSSMFTVISMRYNRAAASNVKRDVMLNLCDV